MMPFYLTGVQHQLRYKIKESATGDQDVTFIADKGPVGGQRFYLWERDFLILKPKMRPTCL